MKIEKRISLMVVFGLSVLAAQAEELALGTYKKIGEDKDSVMSEASAGGATLTYKKDTDTRKDTGIQTAVKAPAFTKAGDKLVYQFTLRSIVNNYDVNNTFRSGFDLGKKACLHFITGYGTSTDGRFAANTNGVPFANGTQVGSTDPKFASPGGLAFNDGSVIKATFTLELKSIAADGTCDYLFTVDYVNANDPAKTSQASQLFTGVAGTTVSEIYHLTNTAALEIDKDTWTVANASAAFTSAP